MRKHEVVYSLIEKKKYVKYIKQSVFRRFNKIAKSEC